MMSCKDVADRASTLMDGELSRWERLQIRLHLAMCKGCAAFIEQMRQTDRIVAAVGARDEALPDHGQDPRFDALMAALKDQARLERAE